MIYHDQFGNTAILGWTSSLQMQAHLDKMQVPVNWLIQSLKQKGSALVIVGILSLLSPLKKVLDDTKIYIINIIKLIFFWRIVVKVRF